MSRYRRSPITALPPQPREQIDRELQKLERALSFEVPGGLGEKADQAALDEHVQDIGNPHETTHAQLSDRGTNTHAQIDRHLGSRENPHEVQHAQLPDKGSNTHAQIDSHISNSSIHTPLPATATLAEAAAGTEPALRSWSPELIEHAVTNLSASFDLDALPELGSGFVDTDRMLVSRGGTEQRAAVTRIAEYVLLNPTWYGTPAEVSTGTETDGRTWTPATLKTAITAEVVDDHGALDGLADDDHPQYHTDARGDSRYDALGSASTVQGNLNAHTGNSSIHAPIPAVMPEAEAEAGTATTQRTISADVLAAAIAALQSDYAPLIAFDSSPSITTLTSTFTEAFSATLTAPESGCLISLVQITTRVSSNSASGNTAVRASHYVNAGARQGAAYLNEIRLGAADDIEVSNSAMMIDAYNVSAGSVTSSVDVACLTSGSGSGVIISGRLVAIFLPGVSV
jgi:hypothetical protein